MRIEIDNLVKVFQAPGRQVRALDGLTMDIRDGEFFSVVGPSGCGKTTLLYILARLEPPTSGEVRFVGEQRAKALTSLVFQDYALLPWRTVQTNVDFPTELKGEAKPIMKRITGFFLRMVKLNDFEGSYPHQLSGGMKQKTGIARALAHDPEILLMDEPFAHLDALARKLMQEELLRMAEGWKKTVVYVTHNIEEAVLLSDRVAVLTRSPGRLQKVIDIDVPRPRGGDSPYFPSFQQAVSEIWDILRKDIEENIRSPSSEEKPKKRWSSPFGNYQDIGT
ncbi:MAG: ABC transporter ATP-binding protein [Chloroflexi bacterium]|nr:ABC transporter ATP-binding protein [Chloroflexota bacterium]